MSNVDLTKVFREEYLKVREHEDPNKHWIGETLAPPSVADASVAGTATLTGDSPFVARADHSHDIRPRFDTGGSSGLSCAGSGAKTYISTLTHSLGYGMLGGTTQTLTVGIAGIYLIIGRIVIVRSTATWAASTLYRISTSYNGTDRTIQEDHFPTSRSTVVFTIADTAYLAGTGTIEFAFTNFDAVNCTCSVSPWTVLRCSSSLSG